MGGTSDRYDAQAKNADEASALALKLAENCGGMRTADLVGAGVSRRTAQRIIGELVSQGLLVPQGNGPSRVYRRTRE